MALGLVLRVLHGPCMLTDTPLQINGAKNDGSLMKPLKVGCGRGGVGVGGVEARQGVEAHQGRVARRCAVLSCAGPCRAVSCCLGEGCF